MLFSSRSALEKVEEQLQKYGAGQSKYQIFSQIKEGPNGALMKFTNTERGVIFGLATFWQGIDIPGDRLRMVILTRIPFQVPDEPLLAARMEQKEQEGRQAFGELQLPPAILSMRQGFGRLLRSYQDRGVVALLDPRLLTRPYGKEILKALPPARRFQEFPSLHSAYQKLFAKEAPSNTA